MRGLSFLLAFALVANLLLVGPVLVSAKTEQPKVTPVKIVKASDTKYKRAKIVETKKLKEKRFLWFRKKEPSVVQPKMAPISKTPQREAVLKPAVEPAASESAPQEDLLEKKPLPQKQIKLPKAKKQQVEAAGSTEAS